MAYSVLLEGGSPWGFRLQGGQDFSEPLRIAKLNPNSKAYNHGIKVGDYLDKINGTSTASLKHNDALQLIRNANNKLELELRRSETTRKKTVIPEIRINGPAVNGTTSQPNGNLSDSDYYYSSCDEEGIVRTNAITNYHSSSGSAGSAGHLSDGDGSSSGSQSSVVHVVGPYKGPLADKMKNISTTSSSSSSTSHQPDGSSTKDKAVPQTTVWSPFGVNKVRTYKPVSFSIVGGATSPASTNQNTAAFGTPSSFAGSTQANAEVDRASATTAAAATAGTTLTTTTAAATTECKELSTNDKCYSSPSYNNFNGSSSVIINTTTPASAYTSITMNSRKVTDQSPTHQYSTFGSSAPPPGAVHARPLNPAAEQSPVKTPTSPIKSVMSPSSPLKSPFVTEYKPVSPPTPAAAGRTAEAQQATSPAGPGLKVGSPPKPFFGSEAKPAAQPGSPTQQPPSAQFAPQSPVKSSAGTFPGSPRAQQRQRPASPTKTVTFGPVTSLEKRPDEAEQAEEPRLSVSQKKSLFEQRQKQEEQEMAQRTQLQQRKSASPATAPKRFAAPNAPKPFKAPSAFGEKSNPPSNTTGIAGYCPVSPRLFSPSRQTSKPLSSPYAPPKSPPTKSKGLEMFLTLQRKLHEPDEELSEFTDSEEMPTAKSVAPAKPTVSSPVIGRAVPIKITSQIRDERDTKSRLEHSDASITKPLSGAKSPISPVTSTATGVKSPISPVTSTATGVKSPISPVTSVSEPWKPSKASALIDAELREREREREQERERGQQKHESEMKLSSDFLSDNKPESTDTRHTQYTAFKLNTASSTTADTASQSVNDFTATTTPSFSWKPDQITTFSSSTVTMTTTTTMATHHTPSTTMSYSSHNGSLSHQSEPKLPTYQSPTITLLQKSRESEVPKEAILVGTKEIIEGDKKHLDTYYLLPADNEHSKSRRIVERKTTKYEGIGPTDEVTGVPIIPRGSVDEKAHKDWYRRMYKSLHKVQKQEDDRKALSDSEDINNYKPTYVFPELDTDSEAEESNPYHPTYEFSAFSDTEGTGWSKSMDKRGYGKRSYTLPHARYQDSKYKVQPMSIENYEPGFSSIAFRERKVAGETVKPPETQPSKKSHSAADKDDKKSYLYNPPIEKPGQYSKYIYSDSEPEIRKKDKPLQPQSDAESREAYKRIQKGGDIPYEGLQFPVPPKKEHAHATTQRNEPRQRHSLSGTGHSPTGSWDSRRRRDEEAARRKQEMKRITAQEKLKRMEEERRANEARRHNDFLTEYIKDKLDDKYWLKLAGIEREDASSPSQKSPIPLNRYDDVPDISDLQRPKKKVGAQYRGKARALYNFKAQNSKELSFKKNDIIYLLRQIDKNWYEGEHHGLVGIFPVNYVEVLMSLDEARQAAILREGHAKAKYNFTAQSSMEVSFKKGDTVSLIRRIDNNWFEGRVDGRYGIFPVSYVEVLREPDTPLPTPMSSYAPTPATGSPGQLSPVSTISNGPAPTIPSAPISPRSSVDNFDFGQPFSFSHYPSSSASLQRPSKREPAYADYGLESANVMRPASALGGLTDGYSTVPRDRYHPASRPNSAVPFSDYLKSSARDPGFYGSEESRYSRQKHREEELMRSLSNPYEGRQTSVGSQSRDSFSRGEEPRYPPYQALYSYKPQNPDELELREGDIVYVMEKCDDDWYVGTSQRTKEFGTFPGNYVRPL